MDILQKKSYGIKVFLPAGNVGIVYYYTCMVTGAIVMVMAILYG
jgi:hypothetical protein